MLKAMRGVLKTNLCVCAFFAVFCCFLATCGYAHASDMASMDAQVRVRPSLTLDISSSGTAVSDITLNLDPASNPYDSKDLNIKVGTNNATGYVLNLSTTDNTTDLTNIGDNSIKIPTLSSAAGATPSSLTANTWGMKKGTGSYEPFAAGTILQNNNRTNEDAITLSFAAKIDYTKQSGKYEQDLVFTITPNVVSYTMQDLDAAICSKDPIQAVDLRDNQTYWVAELDDGNCWMLNNLQLGKDLATTSGSMTLTPANSNISENWTLTGKVVSPGAMPYTSITDDVSGGAVSVEKAGQEKAFYCAPDASTSNSYESCYYNWYTATTGKGTKNVTGKDTTDGVDVNESICPKGWVLPKGGPSGDFENLATFYPTATQMLVDPTTAYDNVNGASQPGFLLNGRYGAAGPVDIGTQSGYWSRTARSTGYGYNFYLNSTTISPHNNNSKYIGFSVRCLRETRTLLDIDTMQEMSPAIVGNTNIGTFKKLTDTRDNQYYMVRKMEDGKIWMLDNLSLDLTDSTVIAATTASNTSASGTAISYLKNGGGAASDKWAINGLAGNWGDTAFTYSSPQLNISGDCSTTITYPCSYDGPYTKDSIVPNSEGVGNLGSHKLGIYYNYCAATAGSFCYGSGYGTSATAGSPTADPTDSICPSGWKLPTGGATGDYQGLCDAINGSSCGSGITMTDTDPSSVQYKLSLVYGGNYGGSSFHTATRQGVNGYYWTTNKTTNAERVASFYITQSNGAIGTQSSLSRWGANSIRCVAK